MHAISFALKRAHWRSVGAAAKVVEKVAGMTPARFDLLYALRRLTLDDGIERDPLRGRIEQSNLRRTLGLHRATVSVMVLQLEEMGWIRRERSQYDRRTFDVLLTERGLRRIRRAMRYAFRCKTLHHEFVDLFRESVEPKPEVCSPNEAAEGVEGDARTGDPEADASANAVTSMDGADDSGPASLVTAENWFAAETGAAEAGAATTAAAATVAAETTAAKTETGAAEAESGAAETPSKVFPVYRLGQWPPKKPASTEHVAKRIHRARRLIQAIASHFGDRSYLWFDYGYAPANGHLRWKFI